MNEYTQRLKYIIFCAAIYSFLGFFKAIFYGLPFLLRATHMHQIYIDNNLVLNTDLFLPGGWFSAAPEEGGGHCKISCGGEMGGGGNTEFALLIVNVISLINTKSEIFIYF